LWGGKSYDKTERPRLLITISGLGLAGSLVLCAVPNIYAAVTGTVLGGITFGIGMTVAFAAAADFNKRGKEYDGLVIAWVNCISLAGLFWPPLVFSRLAQMSGYPTAWVGGAGLTVLFITPFVLMTKDVMVRKGSRNDDVPAIR